MKMKMKMMMMMMSCRRPHTAIRNSARRGIGTHRAEYFPLPRTGWCSTYRLLHADLRGHPLVLRPFLRAEGLVAAGLQVDMQHLGLVRRDAHEELLVDPLPFDLEAVALLAVVVHDEAGLPRLQLLRQVQAVLV